MVWWSYCSGGCAYCQRAPLLSLETADKTRELTHGRAGSLGHPVLSKIIMWSGLSERASQGKPEHRGLSGCATCGTEPSRASSV